MTDVGTRSVAIFESFGVRGEEKGEGVMGGRNVTSKSRDCYRNDLTSELIATYRCGMTDVGDKVGCYIFQSFGVRGEEKGEGSWVGGM